MKRILQEMYWEFMEGNLSVILVPQRDPPNPGACLRVATHANCDWYRDLCGDFESARKRQYRHFKTRVKRREIERILNRLLHDRPTHGKYAEWLLSYAAEKKNNTNEIRRKELDKMTPEERKRLFDRVKDAAQTLLDALKPRTDVVGMMFVPQEVFDAFFGEGAHLKNDIINKRHLFGFEVHQSYGRGNRIELTCWCHDKYCMVRDEDGNEITCRKVLFPAKEVAMQIDVDEELQKCPE